MLPECNPHVGIAACKRNFIFEDVSDESKETFLNYVGKYCKEKIFPGKTSISAEEICVPAIRHIGGNFIGLFFRDLAALIRI